MIEVIQCRKKALTRARMLTSQDHQERGGVISTLEGSATFQAGDYLCIGIHGEEWPQSNATFRENNRFVGPSDIAGFDYYKVVTSCVAFQLPDAFTVKRENGDALTGQPGDYLLVRGANTWPVARSIFEQSYERIA